MGLSMLSALFADKAQDSLAGIYLRASVHVNASQDTQIERLQFVFYMSVFDLPIP